jgi:hypothetical protein
MRTREEPHDEGIQAMADRLPNRLTLARLVPKVADNPAVSAVLLASLLIALSGCDLLALPAPERTPAVVGVIKSSENVTGVWHYELENGQTVDIDFDETETLPDSRGGGDPGTLLFYGVGDEAWYMGLFPARDGSYTYDAAATDDDTHIVFENGLRLPKVPGFDGRGWPQDGRYESPTQSGFAPFCINTRGEVTAYLATPSDQREGCPDSG